MVAAEDAERIRREGLDIDYCVIGETRPTIATLIRDRLDNLREMFSQGLSSYWRKR